MVRPPSLSTAPPPETQLAAPDPVFVGVEREDEPSEEPVDEDDVSAEAGESLEDPSVAGVDDGVEDGDEDGDEPLPRLSLR